MALEKELETYKAKLPALKAQEGKYVLIHGENVIDIFSSYEDALKEGYKQFGTKPFLVKQILTVEPVYHFTRALQPVTKGR